MMDSDINDYRERGGRERKGRGGEGVLGERGGGEGGGGKFIQGLTPLTRRTPSGWKRE